MGLTAARPALGERSCFPELSVPYYLNHAAIGPSSSSVVEASSRMLRAGAQTGMAAIDVWLAARESARAGFGQLVGAAATDVAIVSNTTQGVVGVAMCFPWVRGDRIVVFDGEFPANVTPWQQAAELFGLELGFGTAADFLGDPDRGLSKLRQVLARGGTKLVAVSAVQFQTGLRMPVELMAEACHSFGAQLFVDGIQACGVVPLDVSRSGIDYLAAGGHKWLMGPMGVGALYVRPDRIGALRPRLAGWLSHVDPLVYLTDGAGRLTYDRPLAPTVAMFEGGVWNAAGSAALAAGMAPMCELGLDAVAAHVGLYLDALEAGLVDRGFTSVRSPLAEQRSGILAVLPPAGVDVIALSQALDQRGVATATPDGHLRLSPHWHNGHEQVPSVLDRFDDAVAALRGGVS